MRKIELTQNDYNYKLSFALEDSSGNAVDLSSDIDNIKFKVQNITDKDETLKVDQTMAVEDEVNGKVSYTVQQGDFDKVGEYYGEIEVNYSSGGVETFDRFILYINAELPRS